MSKEIVGNTRGLAASELKDLRRLFGRALERGELVSIELAREIYDLAAKLRRRVGVLISRQGQVEEVCVGTKDILYLPNLGRTRLGASRLRSLRLIFSDLSDDERANIPQDIYTDLEKLRLDLVGAIKIKGNRNLLTYAHIVPEQRTDLPAVATVEIADIGRLDLNFAEFIVDLERRLGEVTSSRKVSSRPGVMLVGVYGQGRNAESSLAELEELSRTAGVEVLDRVVQKREPDPKTVIGKGKLEEVVLRCLRCGAEIIIFDQELKPSQWRAITNQTELKVLDRSMLILDIFAQHARSSDGRLQVELAQLKYTLPRLTERDSGLSRLTGGIGGRGPGETKLEVSRRRVRDRIVELERQIEKLGDQRGLQRNRRVEQGLPQISILGYTNVGKSTLFNALTGSSVLVENKLFATLEPAQRRLIIQNSAGAALKRKRPVSDRSKEELNQKLGALETWQHTVILSDTVGFIRELPAELRTAFRATLEELRGAKLLLHVLDASDPEIREHHAAVDQVISEMNLSATPRIHVLNKIDMLPQAQADLLAEQFDALPVSAIRSIGLDRLLEKIAEQL